LSFISSLETHPAIERVIDPARQHGAFVDGVIAAVDCFELGPQTLQRFPESLGCGLVGNARLDVAERAEDSFGRRLNIRGRDGTGLLGFGL